MATIANLVVELGMEDSAFQRTIKNSREKLDGWGKSLRSTGTKMSGFITAPLLAGSGVLVNWSSELEQTLGATEELWGDNANAIIAWSKTTDKTLGMSQNDTLTSMNRYNAMLKQLEDGTGNVSRMSQELTERSADLSAMWGGSSIEASDALTSALRGNYEGLDKYNINLTEALVTQEAMRISGKASASELTEQEKLQARYNLILEQSSNAQGQFARETDTTAGRLAILRARVTNLATNFGKLLLPYVNKLAERLSRLVDWLEKLSPSTQRLVLMVAALAAAMGPVLIAIGFLLPGLSAMLAVIGFLVSPIGLVVVALGGLAFIFRGEIMDAVSGAIDIFGDLLDAFTKFHDMGLSPVQAALAALQVGFPALGTVIAPIRQLVENMGDAFQALKDGDYGAMFDSLGVAARNVGSSIKAAIGLIDWSGIAGTLWSGLQGAASWVASQVLAIPSLVVDLLGWIAGKIPDVWAWLKGIVFGATQGDGTGGATAGSQGGISIAGVIFNVLSWAKGTIPDVAAKIIEWIGTVSANLASWTLNVAVPTIVESGTSLIETFGTWINSQIEGVDWLTVAATVATKLRGAVRDGVQFMSDITSIVLNWVTKQIEGVDWNSVGSKFAELLVAGIKGVVLLVGFAGYLLGQALLALAEVNWSAVGTAFRDFFVGGVNAIANFLTGFGDQLLGDLLNAIAAVNWGAVGSTIKDFFVSAVSGVGSAIGDAIWGTLPGWLQDLINGKVPGLGGDNGIKDPAGGGENSFNFMDPAALAGLKGGAAGALGAGAGSGMFSGLMSQIDALIAKLGEIAPALSTAQAGITGFVANTIGVMGGWATGIQTMVNTTLDTLKSRASGGTAGAQASFVAFVGNTIGVMGGWVGGITTMVNTALDTLKNRASGGTSSAKTSFVTFVADTIGVMGGWSSGIQNIVSNAMSDMVSAARRGGSDMASALRRGADDGVSGVSSALSRIPGMVDGIAGSAAASAYNAGAAISAGFANGMTAYLYLIESAAASMVAAADAALRAKARIASPSKVFAALGEFVGEGFEQGIRSMIPDVARASADLVRVPSLGSYGQYGATIPAYAYAPRQPVQHVYNDNRTFLALKSEEWVRYAEMAENAPERTIMALNEAERLAASWR